jgi:methylglutaconyl-CoA hydratase
MDLSQVAALNEGVEHPVVAFPSLLVELWDCTKPVIARLGGKTRAGGTGIVASCDIAVASTESDFAFTEVRLGVIPAMISVPILARCASRVTEELFLTGETFGAQRAREMGLINAVHEDVDAEVARYTAMFALCEPKALAGTKKMMRRDRSSIAMADDYKRMTELSASFFASPEAQEGIAAFAAKRAPRWAE